MHRLHKLSIKEDLESQSEKEQHHILFLSQESHQRKVGHGINQEYSLALSDQDIHDLLAKDEARAKEVVNTLGMAEDLIKNNKYDTPPICTNLMKCKEEDDVKDNDKR